MQVQEVLNNALTAGGDSEGVSARTDASQGMGKMAVRSTSSPPPRYYVLWGGGGDDACVTSGKLY